MINFLKSLFVKKQNKVLFFDGDNISINVANVFAVERKVSEGKLIEKIYCKIRIVLESRNFN